MFNEVPTIEVGSVDSFRRERLLALSELLRNLNLGGSCQLRWPTREQAALSDHFDQRSLGSPGVGRTAVTLGQQLRHHSAIMRFGANMLNVGEMTEISMPSIDRSKKAEWSDASADVAPLMDGAEVIPINLSADIKVSSMLLRTSPIMAAAFVESQLLSSIGAAIDDAAINGTGSSEPLGLLNHPAIPEEEGSSAFTLANCLNMEKAVADNHGEADPNGMFWIADSGTRKALRSAPRSSELALPIWTDGPNGGPLGYRGVVSPWAPAKSLVFGFAGDIMVVQFKDLTISGTPSRADAISGWQTAVMQGFFSLTILNPSRSFVRGALSD